ncbi:hypothetical protein CHS0354_032677 [Potamilus streckersoni]|uniref:IMS import disulfide relay-system CHCH-CHCH-like Cx9C domain-containing protein n=1 Tax=Potamilus streckersoni TaxID=2493646 RepID=A0AAE0SHZ7_9BIVA|nr:hypothetical protein CHS0354_032677 [Potamilus streckersoni]
MTAYVFGVSRSTSLWTDATLKLIQKECTRYVDNFAKCVENYPDTWSFLCEKQSMKLAKCSEDKSPIIVRAKMECAVEYEKFNTCMDRNFSKTELCRPEYQIFSDCVSAVQQKLKDNDAT